MHPFAMNAMKVVIIMIQQLGNAEAMVIYVLVDTIQIQKPQHVYNVQQ